MAITKLLCDICKRQFEGDEDLMNYLGEVVCDDCQSDMAESELLRDEYTH